MVDTVAQLSTPYAISFMAFVLLIIFPSRRGFIVLLERVFRLQLYSLPAGSSIKLAMHRMLISLLDLVCQCRPFS